MIQLQKLMEDGTTGGVYVKPEEIVAVYLYKNNRRHMSEIVLKNGIILTLTNSVSDVLEKIGS